MQTKDSLKLFTKGQYQDDSFKGPLSQLTDHYLNVIANRKQIEEQKASEPQFNTPYLAILAKKAEELKQSSVLDSNLPAIAIFDAYLHAQKADTSDAAIRAFTAHLEKLMKKDPMGSLSIKQVADLRNHYTKNFPKSKVGSLIDSTFTEVGYNTLPIRKLSEIASKIETQADYNQVCDEYGLGGSKPEQIRSRAFIRELVNLTHNAQNDKDMEYHPEVNEQQDSQLDLNIEEGGEILTEKKKAQQSFQKGDQVQCNVQGHEHETGSVIESSPNSVKIQLDSDGKTYDVNPSDIKKIARTSLHQIEAMLLEGSILESADNLIRINPDTDNVELWIGASKNGGLETSLSNMHQAIHDFLTHSGYTKISQDAYQVSVNEQQDDKVEVADSPGKDSETQPALKIEEGTAKTTQQPMYENHPELSTSVNPQDQVKTSPAAKIAQSIGSTIDVKISSGATVKAKVHDAGHDTELDIDYLEIEYLEDDPQGTVKKGDGALITKDDWIPFDGPGSKPGYADELRKEKHMEDYSSGKYKQSQKTNTTMGPDSSTQDLVPSPKEAPTPHSSLPEMQEGTEVVKDTNLGPDSAAQPTPELQAQEPILTSRHGPVASISDDYFLTRKDASREYIENLYTNKPSRELLENIGDPDKWMARQAANAVFPIETKEASLHAQYASNRETIRNGMKGNILKKRADLYQIGGGIVGEDVFHYSFGYDSEQGLPSQEQVQAFLNDNTLNGEQRYKIASLNPSGYGMLNISIQEMTSQERAIRGDLKNSQVNEIINKQSQNKADEPAGMGQDYKGIAVSEPEELKPHMAETEEEIEEKESKCAAPRIKEEWNGDKFSREMEAESPEELQMLHKSLNDKDFTWPAKEKEAVDPTAKEYYKEYYGDFGKALTKGDVTKSEPEEEKEEKESQEEVVAGY